MLEMITLFSGGIGVGVMIRFICVILGGTTQFINSLIKSV